MEKEIVSKCAWHKQEQGTEGWMVNGKIVEDLALIEEIERKVKEDIAVISHGCCERCLDILCPDDSFGVTVKIKKPNL